ncbi:MAG: hypothetical protein WBG90_22925 [Saonia sp.]
MSNTPFFSNFTVRAGQWADYRRNFGDTVGLTDLTHLLHMSKPFLITLFLFFGFLGLTAQQDAARNDVDKALTEYFELPRESIFLHLNKSTYVAGEHIWFKGYVYNRWTDLPSVETSNIYVGIYDSIGGQIDKKLYLGKNGYLQGSISIDSTFTSGSYYIKASTNWMKNFTEDDAFVQKVKILNGSYPVPDNLESVDYDVQFFPEGGHMVSGIPNTVGVKVLNQNGYGVKIIDGVVQDKNGSKVFQFKTSPFGLSKFEITPENGMEYKAMIKFMDGQERTFSLPTAKRKGMNILLKNNPYQNQIGLAINTNKETKETLGDQPFTLLIHRDGFARKIDVDFTGESLTVNFLLEKESLKKGMNIITLLDDNGRPVLERLCFNMGQIGLGDLELSRAKADNDSLTVAINLPIKDGTLKNLSLSVLPESTMTYAHQGNILSTFYLKPYIKGFVENPAYYFKDIGPRKEYELDLLLLTQGWSRYSWDAIFGDPPEQLFEFERGIMLNGTINGDLGKFDDFYVFPTKNHTSQTIAAPKDTHTFSISNYFLERDEKLFLSQVKKNGKLAKPKIILSLKDNNMEDRVYDLWKDDLPDPEPTDSPAMNSLRDLTIGDKTIILEEVTVTQEKKSKLAEINPNIPAFLKNRVTEVDQDMAFKFPIVLDIIRSRGYEVREDLNFGSFDRVRITSRRDDRRPLIYLDGAPLANFDVLYQLPTTQVESFFIDKTASREGVRGGMGEVIYIYTRRGKELNFTTGDPNRKIAYEFILDKGFEKTKKFYTPVYATYFDKAFEYYGVVHWEPEIYLDENGKATFKILNTGLQDLSFFIEGMGEDGSLWSTVKTLHLGSDDMEKP